MLDSRNEKRFGFGHWVLFRSTRVLLVCSERCEGLEECLIHAGGVVTKVSNGDKAVKKIRREIFDSVILVSTGRKMDLVETILNLRDINPGTPIVVAIDPARREPSETARRIILQAVPKVSMFTIAELKSRLDWVETEQHQTKKTDE